MGSPVDLFYQIELGGDLRSNAPYEEVEPNSWLLVQSTYCTIYYTIADYLLSIDSLAY